MEGAIIEIKLFYKIFFQSPYVKIYNDKFKL